MKRLLSLVLVMVFALTVTTTVEAKTQTKNEKMAAEYVTEFDDEIYEELKENEKLNSVVKSYKVAYKDLGHGIYKFTATLNMTDKGKVELVVIADFEEDDKLDYVVLNGKRILDEKELDKAYPQFNNNK